MRTADPGRRLISLDIVVACLLVGVAGAELLLYSPPIKRLEQSLSVGAHLVQSTSQSATLEVSITHTSPGEENLRLVAFPLASPSKERSIYVYSDIDYPTASVGPNVTQGLFDHLAGELMLRQYSQAIVPVSAANLASILGAPDTAPNRVVVLMSGVLPATIFSRTVDLLTPWVQAGGLVVWGGATIGYYSGLKGRPLTDGGSLSFGETGPALVLGPGIATFPWVLERTADQRGDFAAALDIQYKFASAGIKRGLSLARGGGTIGWYSGQFSSVTYLPHGQGGYLVFGGEILDEASVSKDLARILQSDAEHAAGAVASQEIRLPSAASRPGFRWELPFGVPTAGIRFVAFDATPDGVFYYGSIIAG